MNEAFFDCAVCSDIGRSMTGNEDNFYLNGQTLPVQESMGRYVTGAALKDGAVVGVFDGMGGEAFGDEASSIGAKLLQEYGAAIQNGGADAVGRYVDAVNKSICDLIAVRKKRIGSTFVLLNAYGNRARAYNIGDSRAYLYRRGSLSQLTRDHTAIAPLIGAGILTPEQAKTDSRRSQLTQHLGIIPEEMIIHAYESPEVQLEPGDLFLLCTDGVMDGLNDETLAACLSRNMPADRLADSIVTAALKSGSRDNVTAAVISVRADGAKSTASNTPKSAPAQSRGTGTGRMRDKRENGGAALRIAYGVLMAVSILVAFTLGAVLSVLIHK